MSIVDNLKEVVALVQKIDNIELLRQIMSLQAEVLSLWDENNRLKAEVRAVKEQLAYAGELRFHRDGYWKPTPDGKEEGPFCSVCWDVDRTLVRMNNEVGVGLLCRYCTQARGARRR